MTISDISTYLFFGLTEFGLSNGVISLDELLSELSYGRNISTLGVAE